MEMIDKALLNYIQTNDEMFENDVQKDEASINYPI